MLAFQITEEDVENVLQQNLQRVRNPGGVAISELAERLLDRELDVPAIERAALRGGPDLDDQTDAADAEIKQQLIDRGFMALEEAPAPRRSRP